MATFAQGDIVSRTEGNYKLPKTQTILSNHFPATSHASTTQSEGDARVEWADEEGALVSYQQRGDYKVRGWLYYLNEDLKLVKRPDAVINNYSIY